MTRLTLREVSAAVADALETGGYSRGEVPVLTDNSLAGDVTIFEDAFGVVAVAVFDHWEELVSRWPEVQSVVAELISSKLGRDEPKGWEGYLVLLTPDAPPPDAHLTEMQIQYDTSLLRKLVGSGRSLETTNDIQRILAPLLPITLETGREVADNLLGRVPQLLEDEGIPEDLGERILAAFANQSPIVNTIHDYMWNNEN